MSEISRWANTQACAEATCPRCGAKPTEDCTLPSGKKYLDVHGARLKVYRDTIGATEFELRHCVSTNRRRDGTS